MIIQLSRIGVLGPGGVSGFLAAALSRAGWPTTLTVVGVRESLRQPAYRPPHSASPLRGRNPTLLRLARNARQVFPSDLPVGLDVAHWTTLARRGLNPPTRLHYVAAAG
jgi:hypothetical protein